MSDGSHHSLEPQCWKKTDGEKKMGRLPTGPEAGWADPVKVEFAVGRLVGWFFCDEPGLGSNGTEMSS